MGLLKKVFKSYSDNELSRIKPLTKKIIKLRETYMTLTDDELLNRSLELKSLSVEKTENDLIVESFALVMEAAFRETGMIAYECQLLGGIILAQGRIAEMKTGEGKTFVILFPSYYRSLSGKGCHVISVNDYLVDRDATFARNILKRLGVTVGCVTAGMNIEEKKKQYNCDITYVTNSELGFDYLRDHIVTNKDNVVLKDLYFCIIDEVDNILIDDAKTPLIISGDPEGAIEYFTMANEFIKTLKRSSSNGEFSKKDIILKRVYEDGDFVINEKDNSIYLTERGVALAEEFFGITNIAEYDNFDIYFCIDNAIRANYLMEKGKQYLVNKNGIELIDEYTGRILKGRRFTNGLHQAIEAKEGIKINSDRRSLATITYQSLFNKYVMKSGCTGTGLTEEKEFKDIYSLDVIRIPTNKPVMRVDKEDSVYQTFADKINAIVKDIEDTNKTGQPVLVGTTTVELSELISERLYGLGIDHSVLNAKNNKLEAEIISHAGEFGAVTVATNMAGRGTDIMVSEESLANGGLKVIGCVRHESRRIDNQLIGRSGRQGNVGESKFYLSLDDDLLRTYCPSNLKKIYETLGVSGNTEIHNKRLSEIIEKSQHNVESSNYLIRKNLNDYDKVNDEQRGIVYEERHKILFGDNLEEILKGFIRTSLKRIYEKCNGNVFDLTALNVNAFNHELQKFCDIGLIILTEDNKRNLPVDTFLENLTALTLSKFINRIENAKYQNIDYLDVSRTVMLKTLDKHWVDHINDLDYLRTSIWSQQLSGKDPVIEYKLKSYDMFAEMINSFKYETAKALLNMVVNIAGEHVNLDTNDSNDVKKTISDTCLRSTVKVNKEDVCPCGSGKKFCDCCGSIL